jgi:hypothetical protein
MAPLQRGGKLLAIGDATSARLLYEWAADEGEAPAAMRLGEPYDAAFLARLRLNGVRGDIAMARR